MCANSIIKIMFCTVFVYLSVFEKRILSMKVNFFINNTKLNSVSLKQKNAIKKNPISFGLNEHNRLLIEKSHDKSSDRLYIIKSVDMNDSDIEPCCKLFSGYIDENSSRSEEMNAIVDRLSDCKNPNAIRDCTSHFISNWSNLFLSTRKKVSDFMDIIGIAHPPAGNLSRTATNPLYQKTAIENVKIAQKYIAENVKQGVCPDEQLLIKIHTIITSGLPFCAENGIKYDNSLYSGIIENSEQDKILLNQEAGDHTKELSRIMRWLERHYEEYSASRLAAWAYKRLLGVSPFYDGNGRTIRSFIDALLYSKGYRFREYPINYAEIRSQGVDEIQKLFEKYCEKIPDET